MGFYTEEDWLLQRVLFLIPLILSVTVHEWAHAWSAWLLGDDTAQREGRLTLSPLAHIDPVGTLLLPALGVPIGWAKPVPVNPNRFRGTLDARRGMLVTAAAGPLSNLCLAAVCLLLLALGGMIGATENNGPGPLQSLLQTLVCLNVALAVFNMLPVPPLDGGRILDALMPPRLRGLWGRYCQIGPFALAAGLLLLYGWWLLAVVQN